MKKIILLLIIFLALAYWSSTIAQTDARIVSSYVVVTKNDSDIINQYFDNVRIETNQTFVQYNNLTDYPEIKANELPEGWIEKDQVYLYNGQKYLCLQSHIRTIYEPSETPALFSTYRANATDTLNWIENEEVEVGWVRTYESIDYECIQAHMTLASWIPPNTPALWQEVIIGGDCPEWTQPTGGHDAYSIGDCVTFNGEQYESLINGNVWSPSAYPAGWSKL